jgi:O-antigen/teichoic acid export membrane protein
MNSDKESTKDVIEDTSGKDRVVKNVVTSWGSHLVLIIIGFIMPRMINDHLGQVSLGIWDLSWSFVNYLSITGFGVGSSVNRYVAKYRSQSDYLSLNRSLSSVVFIQFLIALVVASGTITLVLLIPLLVSGHNSVELDQVRWVVGLLGSSLVVQMLFDTSRGLLSGMHRWDIYNTINATSHILNAVLMVAVLLMGADLIALAIVYFVSTLLTESIRSIVATRLCAGLDLRKEHVNIVDIKKMFNFGAKTLISSTPSIIVAQTLNIFVASVLGPSALAIFARPLALVRHVETFLNKYAFVLTPMVGSISAKDDQDELKAFLIESTKFSVSFSLPLLLFVGVLGDHVLNIWMGEAYARIDIILMLSLGNFLPIAQGPSLRVLMGMNRHGKVAIINLVLTLIMLLVGILLLYIIAWDLVYVALLSSTIFTATLGVITPIYTCRTVGISYLEYLAKSFTVPVMCGVILLAWLFVCRQLGDQSSFVVISVASLGSVVLIPALYWFFILPDSLRAKFINKFNSN